MLSDDRKHPHTAHTTARVPFIMTSKQFKFKPVKPVGTGEGEGINETGGALCDVAPTVLEVMGLPKPEEMTGESLIQ
jgi:2,3-bisphosphoglycerate-independent phosphoglycerate mutase